MGANRGEEKARLIQEVVVARGAAERLVDRVGTARDSLKRLMEEDGDAAFDGREGERAYYKNIETATAASAEVLMKNLTREQMATLLAESRLTKVKVNFLTKAGVPVDKVVTVVPDRQFTVDSPRTPEAKERMGRIIEEEAQKEQEILNSLLKEHAKIEKKGIPEPEAPAPKKEKKGKGK